MYFSKQNACLRFPGDFAFIFSMIVKRYSWQSHGRNIFFFFFFLIKKTTLWWCLEQRVLLPFIYSFFFSVPSYNEESHKKYNVSRKLYQQI